MDVLLNEEETILKNSAREFLTEECPPTLVRAMEEDALGYPPELWRKIAELGWLGFALPTQYGGEGAPLQQIGLLVEEMGRAVAPLPFVPTLAAALAIAEYGSETQRQAILPQVARGDMILTWALTERNPRGTPETIQTTATVDGDQFVLNGTKLFVENFHIANQCLVVCRTDPNASPGMSVFLLDPKSPGVSHTILPTLAGDKQSEVVLQQVRVPASNLLGTVHQGWSVAERMTELATILSCAQMVGATRRAVDMAIDYAKWRVAFGRPIGAFQAIQHMCADMITWVDGAQLLTYEALWKVSAGSRASLEIATAKAFCNDRCQQALRHANQIHGGVAQIKEFDLNLWYRRSAAWAMKLGTSFDQRRKIAQALALA